MAFEGIIAEYGTQIIAVIGTVLGGVVLAVTNRLLDRTKQDRDEARNIREELRKDNSSLRAEMADLKAELARVEELEESRAIEVNRMRIDNTLLMQRFLKLHSLYYDATGQTFKFELDGTSEE